MEGQMLFTYIYYIYIGCINLLRVSNLYRGEKETVRKKRRDIYLHAYIYFVCRVHLLTEGFVLFREERERWKESGRLWLYDDIFVGYFDYIK